MAKEYGVRPSRFLSGSWNDLNIDTMVCLIANEEIMGNRQPNIPSAYKPDSAGGSRYTGRLSYPNMRAFKMAIGMPNLKGA